MSTTSPITYRKYGTDFETGFNTIQEWAEYVGFWMRENDHFPLCIGKDRRVVEMVPGSTFAGANLTEYSYVFNDPLQAVTAMFLAKEIWEFHKKHQTQILPLETD